MNQGTIFLIVLMNFLAYSNGIELLQCRFKNNTWKIYGSYYTCDCSEVSVKNNSTFLEPIEGVHLTGKTNNDVRSLWVRFDETQTQKLPKNIDKFFPNLEVLWWQNGNLTSITADDLRPFSELKILHLGSNKIVSLDSDLFQHTPRLRKIQFSYNQITNVGYDLLENLEYLDEVEFISNPCINFLALGSERIRELKEKLRTQCPPLATTTQSTSTSTTTISTTTTEESCDVRCTINHEVDELFEENKRQSQTVEDLQQFVSMQKNVNANNEEQFIELEKRIREILAKP